MDERVEEIRPISRIRPVRKLTLTRSRRGHSELMYQLNRCHKAQKPKRTNLTTKKIPDVSKSTGSGTDPTNLNDFMADLKKRIVFDKAKIIGD